MVRKGLYSTQFIPFPKKLMNTATSPTVLSTDFARLIVDMLPNANKAGTGRKRYGLVAVGDPIGSGVITHLAEYIKSDGTNQIIAYTNDGVLSYTEDEGTTWNTIKSGMNTSGTVRHAVFNNTLLFVNGLDNNFTWNGTTATDFSEEVNERLEKTWVAEDSMFISTPDDLTSRYGVGETITLRFNGRDILVTSLTQTTGTATCTTTANHNLLVGEKITIRNALPAGYNGEFEITATPTATTFEFAVDSGLSSPATIDQEAMSMVKGESIPVSEWTAIPSPYPEQTNSLPNLIMTSPYRVTGMKGTVGKFPAGGVDRMDVIIYIRKQGETEWILSQTISNVGGSARQRYELSNLESAIWEVRFESGFSGRGTSVSNVEWQQVTGGEIVGNGNRLIKENVVVISSLTRSGNSASATTTTGHGLAVNDAVTIFNVEQEDYNGTFLVTAIGSDTIFTYDVANDPATPANVDPSLTSSIVYEFDNLSRTPEIATSVFAAGDHTLTFTTDVMPAGETIEIIGLDYTASPPPFSFVYTYEDRLWALSGGELLPNTYRDVSETSMFVYYTQEREVIQSWYNADTQGLNFIDLSFKHEIQDELVGISSISNSLVFHGRKRMQIWQGSDPTFNGDLSWAKTIPVGTVHGNLIQELPNDVLFVSPYGVRQVSVAFQTEELEWGSEIGDNIDPTVEAMVKFLKEDTTNYRTSQSFYYPTDGLYGFKAGATVMVYVIAEKSKGWVQFAGKFSTAGSFLDLADGRLISCNNDQLTRYANGVLGATQEYNDLGTTYPTIWFTPWIELNRRWFNTYWEFLLDLNESTNNASVQLRRYTNNDTALSQRVYDISMGRNIGFWDEALWDVDLFDSPTARPKIRDNFKAQNFALAITTDDDTGAIDFVGINAIGAR